MAENKDSNSAEQMYERIKTHKGVEAIVCLNENGQHVRPPKGLDDEAADAYAGELKQLYEKAKSAVRDLDPENDLIFMRIKSRKHEIMTVQEENFLLSVVQDPTATSARK